MRDTPPETGALIALAGNPNTGKTTVFNRLTGASARVGNYPGITVERRSGTRQLGQRTVEIVDLPGCYSLSARSAEEQIAMESVLGLGGNPRPDLVVLVVDAGQLVRNTYLLLQLLELEVPVVVALNMVDELDEPPDTDALSASFGVPFVATNARVGTGIKELVKAITTRLLLPPERRLAPPLEVPYPPELLQDADGIRDALPTNWQSASDARTRGLALWALASIDTDDELAHIDPALREKVLATHAQARAGTDQNPPRDIDEEIVASRYALLDQRFAALGTAKQKSARAARRTEMIDRVLLHPVWGFVVFGVLMIGLFQLLFAGADPAIGVIEDLFGWLADASRAALPEGFFADLIAEGVIGGVGNVVVFLPQILLLFLMLGFLEDSGYMARAAYLMDRIMKFLGLHGRAFVPMLSGCACAIPAIMATRTMERERDRVLTMLVIPLMTCSARLPVYALIIAALFPPSRVMGIFPVQGFLLFFMYAFATCMALIVAAVLSRTVVKGRRIPLLLELPPYRLPTLRSVAKQTGERAWVFLKEAGTVILVITIILWGLLSFPKPDVDAVALAAPETTATAAAATAAPAEATAATTVVASPDPETVAARDAIRNSYGGRLGHLIEPVIEPLGFDWKLGIGIIGAFAAREVFVSTMGVVYGVGEDADEESVPLRDKIRADTHPDGSPIYTPLMGLSLMIFFALACQCMSTLAVVKRETRGWKWPVFLFSYMTVLAWTMSFVVYQGGRLLGFG